MLSLSAAFSGLCAPLASALGAARRLTSGQHFVMDEHDECNALRQVLKERCPDVIFRDDDINKLVDEGYTTAAALAAATKDDLGAVLPGRRGVVTVLLKAFV